VADQDAYAPKVFNTFTWDTDGDDLAKAIETYCTCPGKMSGTFSTCGISSQARY
jgi:hypothetical protein